MHGGGQRWVCRACGANNMLTSQECFRCRALRVDPSALTSIPIRPPQQVYQAPPDLYAVPVAPKTDVCAILSVVFGAVSLLFFCVGGWYFAVAGLVLGLVSLARLRNNPRLTGLPMAIIGVILSSVPLAWALIVIMALGQAFSAAFAPPPRNQFPDPPGSMSQPSSYR